MRIVSSLVVFTLVLTTGCAKDATKRSDDAAPSPSVLLEFNGEDLAGFYTFTDGRKNNDTNRVFSVNEDGHLVISGEHQGYLSTDEALSNYRMVAAFKWGGDDLSSDSGIFFHAEPADRLWARALEVQMRHGATGDLCLIGGSPFTTAEKAWTAGCVPRPGKGKEGVPAEELENPRGQWNTVEVLCEGNRVRVTLNGQLLHDGTAAADQTSGRVYFQSYSGEVVYEKIVFYGVE